MGISRREMLLSLGALGACTSPNFSPRPRAWAQARHAEAVPNLHQITPEFWRSAQPSSLGFEKLESMGVKSVISLRQSISDQAIAPNSTLKFFKIPMRAEYIGEFDGAKIITFFKTLNANLSKGPVLIHCTHGADRTGAMSALYRMLYQNWSREDAISEMMHGGFGYHPIFVNIQSYLRQVELADLKARILP